METRERRRDQAQGLDTLGSTRRPQRCDDRASRMADDDESTRRRDGLDECVDIVDVERPAVT